MSLYTFYDLHTRFVFGILTHLLFVVKLCKINLLHDVTLCKIYRGILFHSAYLLPQTFNQQHPYRRLSRPHNIYYVCVVYSILHIFLFFFFKIKCYGGYRTQIPQFTLSGFFLQYRLITFLYGCYRPICLTLFIKQSPCFQCEFFIYTYIF